VILFWFEWTHWNIVLFFLHLLFRLAAKRAMEQRAFIIEHVIFPALRCNFLPPRTFATDGTVIQVACLEKLYKIFERCWLPSFLVNTTKQKQRTNAFLSILCKYSSHRNKYLKFQFFLSYLSI
jgi:hypothetical protein